MASLTSPWLVNDKPLALQYDGEWFFPAFGFYTERDFGGAYNTAPDYTRLLQDNSHLVQWVLLPPVPHDPLRSYLMEYDSSPPYPPSAAHWLGTDGNGRDILSRLIHGFRICMLFSLAYSLISAFLGIVIGGIQGLIGGKTDIALQRSIEVWSALPFLYVVILIGAIYGQSFMLLLLIMSLFGWIGLSYFLRGEFYKLRNMPFVQSARALGMPLPHIFFKEILPNALTPVITILPFTIIGGIGALTSLDFLGFGLAPPTPSWGELLAQGLQNLYAPWIALSAVAALFVTLLLTTFIGEGVREAMDPRKGDHYE